MNYSYVSDLKITDAQPIADKRGRADRHAGVRGTAVRRGQVPRRGPRAIHSDRKYFFPYYRDVGSPCRFSKNHVCKHGGICTRFNKWGMCNNCGIWKVKNRVSFNNEV